MRTFAALTITGVAGVVVFKVFTAVLLPLLGLLMGLFFLTLKIALIAGVILFIYNILKKRMGWDEGEDDDDDDDDEAPEVEAEVVEE